MILKILGISGFYHDSAAALIVDGDIRAAAQEERFTRVKHDASFPRNSIEFVLAHSGLTLQELDAIVFYDKPFLKFERLLETYTAFAPSGWNSFRRAIPVWLREKLFLKDLLINELRQIDPDVLPEVLLFSEHHLSHAASAFYPSPFEEAVVLTVDGVGEWATTSVSLGEKEKLTICKEIHFPHSIGLLYSAFTYFLGFKVNSGEYKLMGLAPYGEARYSSLILDHLVDVKGDGSFRLNQDYFDYATGLTMTNEKFNSLFGRNPRDPLAENLDGFHMDLAASIQDVTERILLSLTNSLSEEYESNNLCLAGGVALNCVANSKILQQAKFENIWVQPAAGDAGGAIGAAYVAQFREFEEPRKIVVSDSMKGSYLGPEYSQEDIERELKQIGAVFETLEFGDLVKVVARELDAGSIVGWFQGRMEFGPRALGGRSILADPRSSEMQSTLNLKIKFRESFRPFAPAVLADKASQWFELQSPSPYMLFVAQVNEEHRVSEKGSEEELMGIERLHQIRSSIPAVTHLDYSARVQTVHEETNPKFSQLITEFYSLTGCPVLINTSFNVRGEPIVSTPSDAFRCFMGTGMDKLVIGNSLLHRTAQDSALESDYSSKFELD